MTVNCNFSINGEACAVAVDETETLLTVLRDRLSLKGAKRGCNQGVCGACTVLVNEWPMRSCLSLAPNCDGCTITTIESFHNDPLGRRLQRAFSEHGAVQCGFCTPGMLISAHRLLSDKPDATIEDIRAGLSGNLCRCSGYRKIIDAVRHVAEESRNDRSRG
jgi:aerobic carbon-monoxide dehydrogenase small subunit